VSSTFGQVYQAKAPRGPSEPGPSTFLYRVQAPGESSNPIPTPTSRFLHPSPKVPVVRPLGLSLGVPQQPILVPVLGTATHPLVLDQPALDQEYFDEDPLPVVPEQPRVDFDQYCWLFTASKGENKAALDAGFVQYQQAADAYRHACELQNVHLTTCIGYLSN
jgi:hypothetical protein